MRRRANISYAAMASAGCAVVVGVVGLVSCVGDDNATPGPPLDASTSDVTTDHSIPNLDTGTDLGVDSPIIEDAGPDSADATPPCAPGSITGFVPPPYVHAVVTTQFGCSNQDLLALGQSCAGDASTYALCTDYPNQAKLWQQNPVCTACLLTPEVTLPQPVDAGVPDAGDDAGDASDDADAGPPPPTYGPMVVSRVTVPNLAGCVELTDQSDAGLACAEAIQAAWRCEEYACNPTCPVADAASQAAYLACAQAAASTVCQAYASVAASCFATETADDAGATYQMCLSSTATTIVPPPSGPAATLYDIALLFCGS